MDEKKEREMQGQVHEFLMQIALELEASAAGARAAARAIKENRRDEGFPHVQQLYSRLHDANHLLDKFKRLIDGAITAEK